MKRFTQETLEVDEADDKMQLTTFKARLKSEESMVSLAKNPPKIMAKMLLKAQKYMNAEDALAAIKDAEKTNEKGRKKDDQRRPKRKCSDRQTDNRGKRKDEKASQTVKFTLLIMPIDKILAQIKDEYYLEWPRPLHSSPNVCDKNKYYRFHKDHGHYIEDCKDLKEQIEKLIRKGKLQRFMKKGEPSRSIYEDKSNCKTLLKDEDRTSQHPPSVIREIKTITGGPSTGGLFKSLKKSYQR
ncbi:uncharacterized protein LOC142611988 [Castanea sativa]|uniref:uncharacterized protein LOC142611988 n=1 Tax=Castanea sativa TaxID=21020 RepID=UPI003F65389E